MTTQNHRNPLEAIRAGAAILVAASVLVTALPAAASNGNDLYVTRAMTDAGVAVPHRPETDIHFPRR